MRKRFITVLLSLLLLITMVACGSKPKDVTYEDIEKHLGGTLEYDFKTTRQALVTLHRHKYHVKGYITDVSPCCIGDEIDSPPSRVLNLIFGGTDPFNLGDFVYAEATINSSDYTTSAYYNPINSVNTSTEEDPEAEYIKVYDLCKLIDKTYNDTYFVVTGVLYPTDRDGYELYESNKARENGEDSIEIEFKNPDDAKIGTKITIIGNPKETFGSMHGLTNCYIMDNK